MKNAKNETKIDNDLRSIVKESLPQAKDNPWFTRKVINRLPNRRNRGTVFERWALAVMLVILLAATIVQSVNIVTKPEAVIGDLVIMGLLLLSFFFVALCIILPLARN